jgi:hypothetical protein
MIGYEMGSRVHRGTVITCGVVIRVYGQAATCAGWDVRKMDIHLDSTTVMISVGEERAGWPNSWSGR